ncbi:MAG: transcriptional regulator [Gammaproteobacteria bacterium HGW-Gammaproteobacteria-1]|jgi:serine protease DegS|nr:MAG: transcriptional regulator [Gammaproteobacteria bacterium HGW-Gammaproteobacteria-1]
MKFYRPIIFLFQSVTIGLAIAFLVLVWKPDLLDNGKKVVAFIESAPDSPRPTPASGPVSYADAVEFAAPSVVNIYTRKTVTTRSPLFDDPLFRRFFGDRFSEVPRSRQETSLGSGVIVSDQGYILTNNHVVAEAEGIEVALRDGRSVSGKVVGTDPETDLAVIKVELEKLPAITLGDSEHLRVGDVVLAIGNPFGVGQTVTLGIVSATGRSQLGISTFENFIQTDAAINPGNSGGALINAGGELVGVNTAIFSRTGGSQGIGFAIPVSLARGVMQQIIEQGRVSRGWLGVEIQDLNPALAESFGLSDQNGVIIAGVLKRGPADKAGLQPGDVILEINGDAVQNVRSALTTITQTKPGNPIHIKGLRNRKAFELDAEVAERPVQSAE